MSLIKTASDENILRPEFLLQTRGLLLPQSKTGTPTPSGRRVLLPLRREPRTPPPRGLGARFCLSASQRARDAPGGSGFAQVTVPSFVTITIPLVHPGAFPTGPFQHGFQHGCGFMTEIHRVIRNVIEYTEGASFACRICTWSRSEPLSDYAATKLTR
jgi:hypothetical protein